MVDGEVNQQGIDISEIRKILCFLCLELLEFRIMNCMQLLNLFSILCFRNVDTVDLDLPPQSVLRCVLWTRENIRKYISLVANNECDELGV